MKEYYTHLLNAFKLCGLSSNIDIKFAPQKTFHYRFPCGSGESHLRALRPLHLRGCKTDGGDVIDVLVFFSEVLDAKSDKVTVASRVAVAYFKIDVVANSAALILGVHYDFELCDGDNEPWLRHPRFHAQISSDVITMQQIQSVADTFPYQCPLPPVLNTSALARIPTAHMCLASVLVSLAADFFQYDDFKSFMTQVREYAKTFPKPKTKEILDNINADKGSLRSCAWYHRDTRPMTQSKLFASSRGNRARK